MSMATARPTRSLASRNPSGPHASRADELEAAFAGRYVQYQYRTVQFIVEHLLDVSKAFDGDLQEMLVLAVIGQVSLHARANQPERSDLPGISASRLADVTGIARQTVRRKLASLAARGWIEQGSDSSWRLVQHGDQSPARQDLAVIDRRKMRRFAELVACLETFAAKP
jgi:DNA-binding MarR family transcriptional regulator